MQFKRQLKRNGAMWLCVIYMILLGTGILLGQESVDDQELILAPEKEVFTVSSGLIIPWRDSFRGCTGVLSRHKLPNCPTVSGLEVEQRVLLSIFNANATIWHQFDISVKNGIFPSILTKDFRPLAPDGPGHSLISSVVLRLGAESKNWYQVEVNEATEEKRYIRRSDPNWSKVSWTFMFSWSGRIFFDKTLVKLRDKPNGEIIKEYADRRFDNVFFEKLEGDWMYVSGSYVMQEPGKNFYGWIRWRDGRKILVGSLLTSNKIPNSLD